jgi:hypothetical protein
MTYEKVKDLSPENFKRLCGVRKETFVRMVQILEKQARAKLKTGRPPKLSLENQILMTLNYLREVKPVCCQP